MPKQPNKEKEFDKYAAKVAIESHKLTSSYAKFSEYIYQSLQKTQTQESEEMKQEVVTEIETQREKGFEDATILQGIIVDLKWENIMENKLIEQIVGEAVKQPVNINSNQAVVITKKFLRNALEKYGQQQKEDMKREVLEVIEGEKTYTGNTEMVCDNETCTAVTEHNKTLQTLSVKVKEI